MVHPPTGTHESVTSCFFWWGGILCLALTEVVCHVREVLPVAGRGLRCCTGWNISRRRTATSSTASALQCICVVCRVTCTYNYDVDSTGVQVYSCTGVQVYRCEDVQVCMFKLYRCEGLRVCRCTGVKMYRCERLSCTVVQVYRCAVVHVYGCAGLQLYGVSGV
jgi:hypothetical protein